MRCKPGVLWLLVASVSVKMPPMTVVSPSATSTEVTARCVSMDGTGAAAVTWL